MPADPEPGGSHFGSCMREQTQGEYKTAPRLRAQPYPANTSTTTKYSDSRFFLRIVYTISNAYTTGQRIMIFRSIGRGRSRLRRPLTPPYVRFRIRRFLLLYVLDLHPTAI